MDINNEVHHMITVQILENEDVIKKGDFVRQLQLHYEGQSDYLATVSTYGGRRINRLGWIPVTEYCPAWIGKTVEELSLATTKGNADLKRYAIYEFIRGEVPKRHLEP